MSQRSGSVAPDSSPPPAPQETSDVDGGFAARRTQGERRAETETRLLDAATRMIARSGSRGTSVAAVAEAAGYSRGIVTHQFGGKEGLLRAVALHAQQQVAAALSTSHGVEWVIELVDRYFASGSDHRDATSAFLILWSEAAAGEPVLQDIFIERDDWFRSHIADAVQDGIHLGTIRAGVNPLAYAYSLVGQLRGIGMQLILSGDDSARQAILQECLTMVRKHLQV